MRFQYPRLLDGGNQFGVGTVVRPYIIRLSVRSSNFYVWVRERGTLCECMCVCEREERESERAFIVKWCPSQTSERHWSPLNHVTPPPGLRKAAAQPGAVVAIDVDIVKCMMPCTTATLPCSTTTCENEEESLSLSLSFTHTHTLSLSLFFSLFSVYFVRYLFARNM